MEESNLFQNKELKFLKVLSDAKVSFIIVGLSAAALQGAPVVTHDIDLWFDDLADPGIKSALDKVGGVYVPPFGYSPPMFGGRGVEIFDIVVNLDGLMSFKEEIKNTLKVDLGGFNVKVLKLERIIVSKKAANRSKDQAVIPALEDALGVINALGK